MGKNTTNKKRKAMPSQTLKAKVTNERKITVTEEVAEIKKKWFQKREYWIAVVISFLLFIVLRALFPIPNYISDSRAYLFATFTGEEFGMRPLGYSRFIEIVNKFSVSLPSIVWAQFILHLITCIFLTVTLLKFKQFNNKLFFVFISLVSTCNVSIIYLANTVSSDSLFISLTLLGIVCFVKCIITPNYLWIIGAGVIIYLTYDVRFSALYYPIVGIISLMFIIPKRQMLKKLVGIIFMVGGFLFFYQSRLALSEERLGEPMFSAFSGHQMANNAFEVYKHQPDKLLNDKNPDIKMLEEWNIQLMDSFKRNPTLGDSVINDFGIYELWSTIGMDAKYGKYLQGKLKVPSFEAWNFASKGLNAYGSGYIKKYFGAYLRYYILPNTIMLYKPYLEISGEYLPNHEYLFKSIIDKYNVPPATFNTNSSKVPYIQTISFILYGISLLLFIPCLLVYIIKKQWVFFSKEDNKLIWFLSLFSLATAGFLIIAAPIVYRYVVFLPILLLPIEWLIIKQFFFKAQMQNQ